MKLKDLFKSTKSVKSSGLDEIAAEVESQEYIESFGKDKVRFMPNVDYSDPKNFAFYGSAEKYYTDAFVRIKNNYPYDGSQKEKYDWINESWICIFLNIDTLDLTDMPTSVMQAGEHEMDPLWVDMGVLIQMNILKHLAAQTNLARQA